MSKNIVVNQDLMPDWLERRAKAFAEIDRQLTQGIKTKGNGLTLDHLQLLIEHKNPFPVMDAILLGWKMLYKELGLDCDFANLVIPKRKKGFDRLIVVASGMTPNCVYDAIKKFMPAWKYTDNMNIVVSDRKADHDYAVWVRDRVEADEELKNLSANDIKKAKGISGITLEERMLYEIKFFKETGKHLDIINVTLCAGSRDPDGDVPGVGWGDGGVEVSWFHPSGRDGRLRSRAIVS